MRRRSWVFLRGVALLALILLSIGLGLGGCVFATKPYRGPVSPHFDGERFQNTHPPSTPRPRDFRKGGFLSTAGALLEWRLFGNPVAWPDWVDVPQGPRPPERVGLGELRVTFVNHATVLIQMDGLNILTDPVWSDRVGPLPWLGPHRVHQPGIAFEDLPPIDLVLISHNHYDHLDLPTLLRLKEKHDPKFAAGLGTARFLASHGIVKTRDFDWWDWNRVAPEVRLIAVPAEHLSMRGLTDFGTMLWAGFVLEGPSGRVYFAGDTGYGTHFAKIREKLGPVRVAILPIGAYEPRWFMAPAHIDPAEAVQAHLELGAELSVAIHHGTFDQADEGREDPVRDLGKALGERGVDRERFWVLAPGEGRKIGSARLTLRSK